MAHKSFFVPSHTRFQTSHAKPKAPKPTREIYYELDPKTTVTCFYLDTGDETNPYHAGIDLINKKLLFLKPTCTYLGRDSYVMHLKTCSTIQKDFNSKIRFTEIGEEKDVLNLLCYLLELHLCHP